MRLYFLRHGLAESRSDWEGADSERPLTEQGIEITTRVAEHIARLDLGLEAIVSSPYPRALETARIVSAALDAEELLAEDRGLEPKRFTSSELRRIVDAYPKAESLMLVGHDPSMTTVAGDITGGSRMRLRKSGLIRIDITDPASLSGDLVWLVQPKLH